MKISHDSESHPRARRAAGVPFRTGRRIVRVEVHGAAPPSGQSMRRVIEAMRRARALLDGGHTEAEECLSVALDRLIERARSEVASPGRPRKRAVPRP
jgi:hypothetical protein